MEDVKIISDTIQEFNAERFYLCGYYFQHRGKRLHRVVWEAYNGEIPEGYHVHHIDEDRRNNSISNLSLVPGIEHVRNHAKSELRRENGRKAIVLAIANAPEWHGSEEGFAWHSSHVKETWAKKEPEVRICTFCGKEFLTRDLAHKNGNHFCNQNCKAKYARRKKAGLHEN